MKPIHIALLCLSLAAALSLKPSSTSLLSPFDVPGFSEVYNGTFYYGTPEQVHYFKQVSDLVEHFDQEVFGKDTPKPSKLIVQPNLENGTAWGVAYPATGIVKIEANLPAMQSYRTMLHERLHLAGLGSWDHPKIERLEEQFEQLLISYGY